ncbi:MAG: hypothetical protein DMD34_02355 [Gemmatimonadetes bacterium]|nr:MAG: hypothetical protein DMD34_02355 [Gemmatimonadota bacterium]
MLRARPPVVAVAMVLGLLCLMPRTGTAQLSISPTIGVYIPTTELVKAASGDEFKQEVSVTVGGRLGFNFGQRVGLDATVVYAPSNLQFSTSGSSSTMDANVLTGSGRAFVELLPKTNPISLQLNGGVGIVQRSGTAYEGVPDNSDVGGVVGATLRFRLGKVLRLELHAEDFIYKAQYAPDPANPSSFDLVDKQMNDIHLGVGIGIPLLGLGGGGGGGGGH